MHDLPTILSPHQTATFATVSGPSGTPHYPPESVLCVGLTLGVVRSLGLDKCIMAGIRHCSIIQCCFTPRIFYTSPLRPSLPPHEPLATTDLFTGPIVLPFIESHTMNTLKVPFAAGLRTAGLCGAHGWDSRATQSLCLARPASTSAVCVS